MKDIHTNPTSGKDEADIHDRAVGGNPVFTGKFHKLDIVKRGYDGA